MRRGDVHRFRLPKGMGHEQLGERYGVIVQADALLPRSVVLVAPTSRSARAASFRPEVDVAGTTSRVLVEQLAAVDVQRLGTRVQRLTADELWTVDEALRTVLALADGHRYRFTVPLWEHIGEASWHFVTLPEETSDEIKAITDGGPRRGFGSVRVEVTAGPTTWRTSIFPSAQTGCYVLPMKKAVRTAAKMEVGDDVTVALRLLLDG